MRVKQLLLQALSRANHIEDGTPADARELNKARNHLNSALVTYSDANLITAFQKVVQVTGAEEMVIGKYDMKKGKVMHIADSLEDLPDPSRLTVGKDYGECKGASGSTLYASVIEYMGHQVWYPVGPTSTPEEQLRALGCCDYVPDVIVEDMERVTAAMEKRTEDEGPFHDLHFTPLSSFYTNGSWDIYCAVPHGDGKVKLLLPKNLIGRQVKLVYYTSMHLGNDDYIDLPAVFTELLTLAVVVGLLSEDADSDPTQLNNYKEMLGKMENQIMANNANTRRIVRKGEKYVRPLYTGAFIYGRFTP
jgi:hypothetical protein